MNVSAPSSSHFNKRADEQHITSSSKLLSALKECTHSKDIKKGMNLHIQAVENGMFNSNKYVVSSLINMYAKCGNMTHALDVFNMSSPNYRDVVTWTALLHGYVENGESESALKLFDRMDCLPDSRTYVFALSACANLRWLEKGKSIHFQALKGKSCTIYVETALIDMYSKCSSMVNARRVFDKMLSRNVVTWTALIMGYVENEESHVALELFDSMECVPDSATYLAAVLACSSLVEKENTLVRRGEIIHSRALESKCFSLALANSLIDLYMKCGSMVHAKALFDSLAEQNIVTWNTLIRGYVENGENHTALDLFDNMKETKPDGRTFVALLAACSSLGSAQGKCIHSRALASDCYDIFVQTALMDMYSNCRLMSHGRIIFDSLTRPDAVCWTTLLYGYVENGESLVALDMFEGESCGVLDARGFYIAISAVCGLASKGHEKEKWLAKGKYIHYREALSGFCDIYVENALVQMYGRCSCMFQAQMVFENMVYRNVMSWNSLIMGYVENEKDELGLKLLYEMDIPRDTTTYTVALTACANLVSIESGKTFHIEILRYGFEHKVVLANCLVDFYTKFSDMKLANHIFDATGDKTIVSYTALMCGYGEPWKVLELFNEMLQYGIVPDEVTCTCFLTACSHTGLTEVGKRYFYDMHAKYNIVPNIKHYACMIDILGRSNSVEEAFDLIRNMPMEPSVAIWTSILSACRKWDKWIMGRVAYGYLMSLNGQDSSAYVLMSNIYENNINEVIHT